MITTAPLRVLHVTQMNHRDIDALIDSSILGFDPSCNGRIEYFFKSSEWCNQALWQCVTCGAHCEPYEVPLLIGDQGCHARLTPHYTASMSNVWPVIECIASYGKGLESMFLLNAVALSPRRRTPLTSSLIFQLSPMQVALAGLATFGVIDEYGFVVSECGGGDEQQR